MSYWLNKFAKHFETVDKEAVCQVGLPPAWYYNDYHKFFCYMQDNRYISSTSFPTIIYENGDYCFFKYGEGYHRENFPAYVRQGNAEFHLNGGRHRINGPNRILHSVSEQKNQWSLYGKWVSARDYFIWLDEVGIDINNLTDTDKLLIYMKYY